MLSRFLRLGCSLLLVTSLYYNNHDINIFGRNFVVESSKSIENSSTDEDKAINLLANNCGVSVDGLKPILDFTATDKSGNVTNCKLVPIYDCQEHKNCFLDIFSKANTKYMKYYLSGKLETENATLSWFASSVKRAKIYPAPSITFLIKIVDNGDMIGRVGMGPLIKNKSSLEIGYALKEDYSNNGIMKKAVSTTLNFLQYIKDNGKDKNGNQIYEFDRIRATAKPDNIASNHILDSTGFKKSEHLIDDGYGKENEYFFYFKQ